MKTHLVSCLLIIAGFFRLISAQCRQDFFFPHITSPFGCTGNFTGFQVSDCLVASQWGYEFSPCGEESFACSLKREIAANNSCPNAELPVSTVRVNLNRPTFVSLGINVPRPTLDVILLLDAVSSTRERIIALKPQIVSFIRQLEDVAENIHISVSGTEESFDQRGTSVLQRTTNNFAEAVQSLDEFERLPPIPDGPRASLRFLLPSITNTVGFRSEQQIVVLVGDTSGREPTCVFDRFDRTSFPSRFSGGQFSVVAVSIGDPGLNAPLPTQAPCTRFTPFVEAVTANQASTIANLTQGAFVEGFDADTLLQTVMNVSRNAPGNFGQPTGFDISVPQPFSNFRRPFPSVCDGRVQFNSTMGNRFFLAGPLETTVQLSISLANSGCMDGPFQCPVTVSAFRNNQFGGFRPAAARARLIVSGC
ncbi:hypothetical protein BWQ96_09103 [Gracilariopsis chorda]|uniref:VWFA domain-containing protein n=1 Tax=Gracilariopsis chorda TaxID=448386 RepID=A0A2V3IGI2_9FLOR|nr:hypothetical protein BWQ96_09103 [Gracilariopsis chorda]|eukprot:PXF41187.1 hypothetical protein BWQ96_09103 [Gracilariopsis chorda]